LQFQAVGAAGEEDGIGSYRACIAVKTASDRARMNDGQVAAMNAYAASTATCRKAWRWRTAIAALKQAGVENCGCRPADAATEAARATRATT
jgi:hypothetical protein